VKITVGSVAFAAVVLGGCQSPLTLEQAQARCAAQGGLLTVIYTQSITASGIGDQVGSPGECISPDRFEAGAPEPAGAPPPAK
jgi:hypothetical protein